jgi:hypothetical protein
MLINNHIEKLVKVARQVADLVPEQVTSPVGALILRASKFCDE